MSEEGPSCSSNTNSNGSRGDEVQMEKLKVLCLHGYRQNGDTFRAKTGSFRKLVKKYADFVYITAPHKAPPLVEANTENSGVQDANGNQRSWWSNKDDGTFKGTNQNGPAIGFEESLKYVEKCWREEGPFQGLLGFSQGACFAALICLLSTKSLTSIKPQFVILAAGFKSGSLAHKNIYENSVMIPNLLIFGESDEIIPASMSEELDLYFINSTILKHPGGHYLPASAQQKDVYIKFFQNELCEYLDEIKKNKRRKESDMTELETN